MTFVDNKVEVKYGDGGIRMERTHSLSIQGSQ